MYKYLSIVLAALLLVVGVAFLYESHSHQNSLTELNNQVAVLQGTVKEKDDLYSRQAVELNGVQDQIVAGLENKKQIESLLKDRDEQIFSLNKLVLKWKDQFFQIKNAKQTVVSVSDGKTEVQVSADCQACLKDLRLRVDFDQAKDYLKASGYTLTNPAYAEIKLEWTRDLKINIVIAKDSKKKFRAYLDTNNSDIFPSDMNFVIEQDLLERRWYEKVALLAFLDVGQGVSGNIGIGYELMDKLTLGPNFNLMYDGLRSRYMFGITSIWFPFR